MGSSTSSARDCFLSWLAEDLFVLGLGVTAGAGVGAEEGETIDMGSGDMVVDMVFRCGYLVTQLAVRRLGESDTQRLNAEQSTEDFTSRVGGRRVSFMKSALADLGGLIEGLKARS